MKNQCIPVMVSGILVTLFDDCAEDEAFRERMYRWITRTYAQHADELMEIVIDRKRVLVCWKPSPGFPRGHVDDLLIVYLDG